MKITKVEAVAIYHNASRFLREQWPNYQEAQACLYTKGGEGYIINTKGVTSINSTDYHLYGSTTTSMAGVLTAIVDLEAIDSNDEITAIVVHELLHVHQLSRWTKISPPNPEWLMTYPNDYKNEYLRQLENNCLLGIYHKQSDDFRRLSSLRQQRQSCLADSFNHYEKTIETFEGCAYFLQLAYLESVGRSDQAFLDNFHLDQLDKASSRVHYLSKGAMMALLLQRHRRGWKNDVEHNGKMLMELIHELNNKEVSIETIEEDAQLRNKVLHIDQAQEAIYDDFMKSGTILRLDFSSYPEIRSVDPMHMDALDNHMMYHQHMIQLAKGDHYVTIDGRPSITVYDTSIWRVKSIYIEVDDLDEEVLSTGVFKNEHMDVSWQVIQDEVLEGRVMTME